jgi:transcriptional regulator
MTGELITNSASTEVAKVSVRIRMATNTTSSVRERFKIRMVTQVEDAVLRVLEEMDKHAEQGEYSFSGLIIKLSERLKHYWQTASIEQLIYVALQNKGFRHVNVRIDKRRFGNTRIRIDLNWPEASLVDDHESTHTS